MSTGSISAGVSVFLGKVRGAMPQASDAAAQVLATEVRRRLSGRRKSGRMLRSVRVTRTGGKSRVGVYVPYARITELGGVITAKKQYLTIPISAQAKSASSSGQSARQAFPEAFVLKTRRGTLLLVTATDRGFTIHYKLVRSVRRAARPYLRPAAVSARGAMLAAAVDVLRRSVR
jgi:hypothetical protein